MGLRMFLEPNATESKSSPSSSQPDPTAPARSAIRRQRSVRHSPGSRPTHRQSLSSLSTRRHESNLPTSGRDGERRAFLLEIQRMEEFRRQQRLHQSLTPDDESPGSGEEAGSLQYVQSLGFGRDEVTRQIRSGERPHGSFQTHDPSTSASSMRQPESGRDMIIREPPASANAPRRSISESLIIPSIIGSEPPNHSLEMQMPASSARSSNPANRSPVHQSDSVTETAQQTERTLSIASMIDGAAALRTLSLPRSNRNELSMMLAVLHSMMARDARELSFDYLTNETNTLISIGQQLDRIRSRVAHGAERPPESLASFPRAAQSPYQSQYIRSLPDDLDGLGDRQRSFSPEAVSWEAMLTTIPPDDQVPSAHSSFNSATASASFSSEGTFISSNPSTTPSSTLELEPCPVAISPSSDGDALISDDASSSSSRERASTASHLDRIESLSRRLRSQRRQGNSRRQRMAEHEAELQRLESILQRLERQIDDNSVVGSGPERYAPAPSTTRERL